MNWTGEKKEQIRRYLLGDAPEPEQLALEKLYFANPERFEEICDVENDLVDHFVRGRLSSADRRRFETYYLSSAARRQKVAFAKSLARAAAAVEQPQKQTEHVSWWTSLFGGFRSPALASALAMAVIALAVLAVWGVRDAGRLRGELARARQQEESIGQRQQELERQIATRTTQSDDLTKQLEQLREQQKQLEASIAGQKSATPSIVSLILNPGLARAGGNETPRVVITPGTDQVMLKVNFEGGDYRSYRVELKTVEGAHVFRQQGLKAQKIKNGAAVIVKASAHKLTRGDYILTLSGVRSTGEIDELNRYYFRVEKK